MKVKRLKHAQKILTFYKTNFAFHPPFQILIDGTFCKAALTFKINIAEQLPKYVEAEVQLNTTSCAMAECEALGSVLYGPLKVLRQYTVVRCGHKEPISAAQCLKSLVKKKNKNKYLLATQDQDLTEICRNKAGIPLLYIAHNTISLESPSDASKSNANQALKAQLSPTDYEHKVLAKLKVDEFGEHKRIKRKKKKKGANPLSCKPKKVKEGGINKQQKEKKKRKRKRLKVSDHVKEHLQQMLT